MRTVKTFLLASVALLWTTGCAHAPWTTWSPGLRVQETEIEGAVLGFRVAGPAEGYLVQRKDGDGPWNRVGEVRPGAGTFKDPKLAPGSRYSYRLVRVVEYGTTVIRGSEEAVPFSADLEGASRITLIATDAGDGNGNDHAIWGSPVLVKKDGTRVPLAGLKPEWFNVGWGEKGEPRTIGIGTRKYPDSIWAHAYSEIAYSLDGGYSRFDAMVGVDEAQGGKGSVAFRPSVVTGRTSEEVEVATPALVDSPGNNQYHVDSVGGNDASDGLSPATAWKSLRRVNGMKFAPGDRILLMSGSRFPGQLKPHGSGSEAAPIIIDRYGQGERPCIDGEGRYRAAIHLAGVEYWRVSGLEVTNTGPEREANRVGVLVDGYDCGVMHDIRLAGLFIHDVNGSLVKSAGGGYGILWGNGGGKVPSYFDGLLIENCHLVRCDRNGICGWGYGDRNDWHPSLNVVIRGNLLEDIGGDCIVPVGTDGCLIERNTVRGGRMRADDYAAGIWPWACDNTLVQFNEVSGMKGVKDGQGFDSDYNCQNSVFQYNYSHDNDGGFMLICNSGETGYSLGNIGTIVRYNISRNDGERTFQLGGPTRNTTIHNNVIYVRKGMDVLGIFHNDWNGWSDGVKFYNNIFYADGKMRHEYGKSTNNSYSHNAFFGNHENPPADAHAVRKDPMLANPGSGGAGFDSLKGYQLKKGSPCIGAGRPVERNTDRDFWGNPLPKAGKPLSIGAHQPAR